MTDSSSFRADFERSVHLAPADFQWTNSPQPGVERMMFDRLGDEVAVATSLVRYAPNSTFPTHQHELGEEFVVLEGEFADEHARYPAGTYVRNPPGTEHAPFSDPGCLIFVKLRQFALDDLHQFNATLLFDTPISGWHSDRLHQHADESVALIRAAAGERVALAASYYLREVFVLSGSVSWQQAHTYTLGPYSWIRLRPGEPLRLNTLEPSVFLTKTRPWFGRRA